MEPVDDCQEQLLPQRATSTSGSLLSDSRKGSREGHGPLLLMVLHRCLLYPILTGLPHQKLPRGQEEGQLELPFAFSNMEDIKGRFERHLGW